MTAGMNLKFNIWRIEVDDDDYVGGALHTGTVVYYGAMGRMQANPEEQLVLQQGLETVRTFTIMLQKGDLDIRERDEAEVIAPYDHPYLNKRFRILSVSYSNFNPRNPNNYMMLQATRSVRAHRRQ